MENKNNIAKNLPKIIEIEPIQNCNFKCTMCHVSVMSPNNIYLDKKFVAHLNGFPENTHVTLGTSFEPTMNPDFGDIVNELSQKGFKISMTTNGSLFTDKLIDKIKDANYHQITFSFDSANKDSYEKIRINANYDKVVKRFLKFKNMISNNNTYFSINCTILKENMYDIPMTIEFAEKNNFNSIGLIAAVYKVNDTVLKETDFVYDNLNEYKNVVLNSIDDILNKGYKVIVSSPLVVSEQLEKKYPNNVQSSLVFSDELLRKPPSINGMQRGKVDGMPVECVSPFVHARIMNDGRVMLCNRHTIGNIYEDELKDIWFGEEAEYVRKRIMNEPKICFTCSYYRFCINQHNINYEDEHENDRILNIRIDATYSEVESIANNTIIKWKEKYYIKNKNLNKDEILNMIKNNELKEYNSIESIKKEFTIK